MGDMKIQKRYNEYLECLGDNITDTEKVMESIKKIINEETLSFGCNSAEKWNGIYSCFEKESGEIR